MPTLFKNYHIVIFKDREGGFRNLRLRGWFGIALFLLIAALAGGNIYLLQYHTRAKALEGQLVEARQRIQQTDGQLLSLSGKVNALEGDLERVRQFDAKLRVLMNIGDEKSGYRETDGSAGLAQENATSPEQGEVMLSRHRELFTRRMHSIVEDLGDAVYLEEVSQQTLTLFWRENQGTLLATPSIWPADGFLSSGFGWRSSPYRSGSQMHKGIDIANRTGTPIWAPARGTVTFVGTDKAYGLCVLINHGNNIATRYAHLSRALVKEGQSVQRGDVIAAMGNTGRSTGPHLHYEVVVDGVPVDPMRYILN